MSTIIARTYEYTHELRAYVTYAVVGVCMTMMAIYMFNMYHVISTSVALQHAEEKMSQLQEKVQKLDSKYISLSNRITPDLVKAHGMSEGTVTTYISRKASLGVVSLGGHEF